MYGNNIGGPFIVPNSFSYGPMLGNNMIRGAARIGHMGIMNGTRGGGLSSLFGLGRGVKGASAHAGAGRSLNLGTLLNSASKALGVVNQAIPIVKEVGPMMNNMKSMLKLASLFKDETDTVSNKLSNDNTDLNSQINKANNNIKESTTNASSTIINSRTNDNEPNFFL